MLRKLNALSYVYTKGRPKLFISRLSWNCSAKVSSLSTTSDTLMVCGLMFSSLRVGGRYVLTAICNNDHVVKPFSFSHWSRQMSYAMEYYEVGIPKSATSEWRPSLFLCKHLNNEKKYFSKSEEELLTMYSNEISTSAIPL